MLMPSRIASFDSGGVSVQPDCPACGGRTVRRTAQSGPRAGAEFWGCDTFPQCQGSIAVAVEVRSAAARLRDAASAAAYPSSIRAGLLGLARPAGVAVTIWDEDAEPPTSEPGLPAASPEGTPDHALRPRSIQAMRPVANPDAVTDLASPSGRATDAPLTARARARPWVVERTDTTPGDPPIDAPAGPGDASNSPPADRHAVVGSAPSRTAAAHSAAMGLSVAIRAAATAARRSLAGLTGAAPGVQPPPESTAPSSSRNAPGASAQAEFERRAARHRAAAQATLPTVVAVTILGMAAATFAFGPFGSLIAALGAAAVGLVGASFIGRLPADALGWRSHAVAERRTAASLEPLESAGYVVLHDRTVPGVRPNVDHVVIGPAGIFVIETRNLRGALAIVGETLFAGERARRGLVEATYREAVAVQIALSEPLRRARLTVQPIVCVHGTPQLLLEDEVHGLRVVSGTELQRFLGRQPFVLGAAEVQDLAAATDRLLRPAVV
jgi:hypothetical protein